MPMESCENNKHPHSINGHCSHYIRPVPQFQQYAGEAVAAIPPPQMKHKKLQLLYYASRKHLVALAVDILRTTTTTATLKRSEKTVAWRNFDLCTCTFSGKSSLSLCVWFIFIIYFSYFFPSLCLFRLLPFIGAKYHSFITFVFILQNSQRTINCTDPMYTWDAWEYLILITCAYIRIIK